MKDTEFYAGLIVCLALGGLLTIIIHKLAEHRPKYIIDIDEGLPLFIQYMNEKYPFIAYEHMIDDKFGITYFYPSQKTIKLDFIPEYISYKHMSIEVGREESEILSLEDWANTYKCGDGMFFRSLYPPMLKMPCPMFYGQAPKEYDELTMINKLVKERYPQYFK